MATPTAMNIAIRPKNRTPPLAFEVPPVGAGEWVPLALLLFGIGASAPLTTLPIEVDVPVSEDGPSILLTMLPVHVDILLPPAAPLAELDLPDSLVKPSSEFSSSGFVSPPALTEALGPISAAVNAKSPFDARVSFDTAPAPSPAPAPAAA